METRENILQELQEISPVLTQISNSNVYVLPAGYFENFASEILFKIAEIQMPAASNPYQVPAGYFDGFAVFLLQKVKTQENQTNLSGEIFNELQQVAPLLNSIPKTNVYTVPGNYFEELSVNITVKKSPAEVIRLKKRVQKWFAYAAAACIIAVISTGIYFFIEYSNRKNENLEFATEYKNITNFNIDRGVATLSDEEIINYLDIQPASTDIIPATNSDDTEFQQMLDNTSDDEINEYLKDNREPGGKNI